MSQKKTLIFVMLFLLFMIQPLSLKANAKEDSATDERGASEAADAEDEHVDQPAFQHKKTARSLNRNKEVSAESVQDRRVIVKTKDDKDVSSEKWNVEQVSESAHMKDKNYIVVRIPEDQDYNEKFREIEQDEAVALAEPNYTKKISGKSKSIADKNQWYMGKIGINKAWDISKGSEDTTIAVLDSGVDADHPALKNKVLSGYNFVDDNENTADDIGHGTSVSSIIAASSDRKKMKGIDRKAEILPVKVSDAKGEVSSQNIVDGIDYAIDQGADIINMSYGSYKYSEVEEEAIADAYDEGIILVASSGNDGSKKASYPAFYPGVIGVSSTGKKDELSPFSNFGSYIDIAAPGEDIYSADFQGGYTSAEGTSFSAPIVSGVAGLMKAEKPDWDQNQIAWALEDGASASTKSEWNNKQGYGRIDAAQTLTSDLPDWSNNAPDKKKKAKELEMFQTEKGKINYPMDVDWYTFHVKKEGRISVAAKTSTDTLDLVAAIDGPGKDNDREFYDDNGKGENEQFSFQAEEGDYHIAIYDYNQHWSTSDYTLRVNGTEFSDVKHYQKEIAGLENRNILRGYPNGTFKPRNKITRQQAVNMILDEKGIDSEDYDAPNPHFFDVKTSDSGYQAIAAAIDLGIMKGKNNHTFDPYGHLTRSQMASIMVGSYDLKGSTDKGFKDVKKNHWAHREINTLAANDIVNGYPDNTYKPKKKISRQQFAKMFYNYLKHNN